MSGIARGLVVEVGRGSDDGSDSLRGPTSRLRMSGVGAWALSESDSWVGCTSRGSTRLTTNGGGGRSLQGSAACDGSGPRSDEGGPSPRSYGACRGRESLPSARATLFENAPDCWGSSESAGKTLKAHVAPGPASIEGLRMSGAGMRWSGAATRKRPARRLIEGGVKGARRVRPLLCQSHVFRPLA